MEKDQNIDNNNEDIGAKEPSSEEQNKNSEQKTTEKIEEVKEITPEEQIIELEDKVARTFAEMENQRRRFEKE